MELRELLTQLVVTQGRKVVVFSQWKRMLRLAEWATSDLLREGGLRAAYFTGDEGQKYRLGQAHPVEIYSLVSTSGIESRISSIVGDKKALFDGLFDGTTDEVAFEKGGSFLSTVQRLVDPVVIPEFSETTEDPELPADTGDVTDLSPGTPDAASKPPSPAPVAEFGPWMKGVRMERLADGRMRLEAPPEAAATLAAVFEGMAGLFRQAAEEVGQVP